MSKWWNERWTGHTHTVWDANISFKQQCFVVEEIWEDMWCNFDAKIVTKQQLSKKLWSLL